MALATSSSAASKKQISEEVSWEISTEASYVAGSQVKSGDVKFGHFTETANSFQAVASRYLAEGMILRLGGAWERYSFGTPADSPLPNTLQSGAAVMGVDFQMGSEWLVRFEVQPGVYSDFSDLTFDDVNAPATLGASCLFDKDLQFVFGISVDPRREYPVMPGAGLRWQFEDRWTLNAILPRPRLEWAASENLTLHAGVALKGGSYRLADNFGDTHRRPGMNGVIVDYSEVRAGLGASWKPHPAIEVILEGGYMVWRTFDAWARNVSFRSDPAPYGGLTITAGF
ncbi:MAG: hypothetical protein IT578_11460 [Verrucomicrobiae bacterium]|nr:hypothetical protein [Verrucomicrobiae bacterium]